MKTLLSALALATAFTAAALAGPVPLTDAQLDAVTAGGGGAGVDPSVYGVKGSAGQGGDGGASDTAFPTTD